MSKSDNHRIHLNFKEISNLQNLFFKTTESLNSKSIKELEFLLLFMDNLGFLTDNYHVKKSYTDLKYLINKTISDKANKNKKSYADNVEDCLKFKCKDIHSGKCGQCTDRCEAYNSLLEEHK